MENLSTAFFRQNKEFASRVNALADYDRRLGLLERTV